MPSEQHTAEGRRAYGSQASHPDEFRADLDALNVFDPSYALGYFRRLEVLLDACPVDIYAASSLKHPWPYRLQNAAECYPASFWRSQERILDSAIVAPELSNADVLEHAVERHATAVVAKDYLPFEAYEEMYQKEKLSEEQILAVRDIEAKHGDHIAATTESIREFADLYDPSIHPDTAYIPLQPPHDEHVREVWDLVENSDLQHRYMLGGFKDATPADRIEGLLAFRAEVGPEPVAHGLGWGLSDELVRFIRDEPEMLDSVDNSGPAQAIQNGKVLDKHWRANPCAQVDGQYQNAVGGAFEFAMLVQAAHRFTEFNDDFVELTPEDLREDGQVGLEDLGGARADD